MLGRQRQPAFKQGDLIAMAYVLTFEDPHRFVGLQPARRNSGESEPQMHISKERDEYLRALLVQGGGLHFGTLWGRQ